MSTTISILKPADPAVEKLLEELGFVVEVIDQPVAPLDQEVIRAGYNPLTVSPRDFYLGLDED